MCQLDPAIKKDIIACCKKYNANKVILFGSRARGDNGPYIDIDLAIKGADNFFSSLDTLHEASVTDYTQNKIVLSGCVNTFCLTFELSWKAMKYVLESEGVDKGRTGSPKLILMAALTRGLIEDENAWLRMLRLLNDESHHYNQDCAIELCRMIPELLPYFDDLKEKIIAFGYGE